MPYYIYRVKPFGQLDQLSAYETFPEASKQAKILRITPGTAPSEKIKMIFADNPLHAEDLVCEVRTAGPKGDD